MTTQKKESALEKRLKLELPKYTLGEELLNSISHGLGAGLSVVALVLLIIQSVGKPWLYMASYIIYGISLFTLYISSTMYHALGVNKGKKVFQTLDHCSIFLLISGTYTPFCLLVIKGVWGWIIFGIVWSVTVIGIILNSISVKKFAIFSMICYIAMGWCIVIRFRELYNNLETTGIVFLIIGGISYTIGAALYAYGKKKEKKYVHGIWHFFVLAASVFHFFSLYFYII